MDFVLTVTAGLATTFLGWAAKTFYDRRNLPKISGGRRGELTGRWHGEGVQPIGPGGKPFPFRVTIDLVAGRKTIAGTCSFTPLLEGYNQMEVLLVRGTFYSDRHLLVEYRSAERAPVQFGTILLTLQDDGKRLVGRVMGWGPMTQRIVHPELKLVKEST